MNQKQVGIVLFGDVEALDFCGPYEVFTVTRLGGEEGSEETSPFRVALVAQEEEPISAAGGLRVLPDYTFTGCPPLDILVVPGGRGVRREMANERLVGWLAERGRQVEMVTSVCTGAILLGRAGLLDGRRATTHRRALEWMRELFPAVTVEEGSRVVEDGRIITSAGISAGIDLALRIVSRVCGEAVARRTADRMEYPFTISSQPDPPSGYGGGMGPDRPRP